MNRILLHAFSALLALTLAGCVSLNTTAVTITRVVDSMMQDWAKLSVQGKTTQEIDAKVMQAHEVYRRAAGVAYQALSAYALNADKNESRAALESVRSAAIDLLDAFAESVAPERAAKYYLQLRKSKSL
jgi:hypothetical protein